MAYTYPIDPKAMFEDRRGQFIGFGVPAADVAKLEGAITDMWANAPGGWVYEWSALARRYLSEGQHYLASLAYGCAKFPCLADQAKADALALQTKEYLASSAAFPVHLERRVTTVPCRGATVDVPVHILSAVEESSRAGCHRQRRRRHLEDGLSPIVRCAGEGRGPERARLRSPR